MTSKFNERFQVPEAAFPVIAQMVNEEEILLIESLDQEYFTEPEAYEALQTSGVAWTMERVNNLLENAYRRGVIEYEDDTQARYKIGSFYTRLDIFAISEPEIYQALPRQIRKELDEWYFQAYASRLDPESSSPTADRIVLLEQALEIIDSAPGPIWLNRCDCRSLAGNCNLPADVCISFRNGVNTFSHRGWSKPLTKEQAKAVLERADQAGLIHTVNPGGICNCCGDCCYLFRAQQARHSFPEWPKMSCQAAFRPESCVGCGFCIERCHFGAFDLDGGIVQYHPERCRGCGLCSLTCPAGAIDMVDCGNR